MARVLHQEYIQDPVVGLIGIHRVEFQGSTGQTLTFPAFAGTSQPVRVVNQVTSSAPATAVLASAITCSGIGIATETLVIGGITYTFRAAVGVVAPFDVFIGVADAGVSLSANILKAINGEVAPGVVGPGTPPNAMVYATAQTTKIIDLTARFPGATGNIAVTETIRNGSVNTPLAGGAGIPITSYVTSASTGAVTFSGMVAGDVVDLVTYHGSASLNYTSAA